MIPSTPALPTAPVLAHTSASRATAVAQLRDARPDDAEALATLERDANVPALGHVFPPDLYPYPLDFVRERWAGELTDPSFAIRVAEIEDRESGTHRVVGYCACRVLPEPDSGIPSPHADATPGAQVWLEHLAVSPDQQGSGLAAELVLDARRRHADQRMHLWVLVENPRARRFYEREGWQTTQVQSIAPYPPYPPLIEYIAMS